MSTIFYLMHIYTVMLRPCYGYVTPVLRPCYAHVTPMLRLSKWLPADKYLALSILCGLARVICCSQSYGYVTAMLRSCYGHVTVMLRPCYGHVTVMLQTVEKKLQPVYFKQNIWCLL